MTRLASGAAAFAGAWSSTKASDSRQRRQTNRVRRPSRSPVGLWRFTALWILLHDTKQGHSSTIQRAGKPRRLVFRPTAA